MIDKEKILALAAEELADANTKHPPTFSSMHEAYAVIKEELEEVQDDMMQCKKYLDIIWDCTKTDNSEVFENYAGGLKQRAVFAVREMIQVIAMCDKALQSTEK